MAKIHTQGELLTISDQEGLSDGLINDDIRPTKFSERTWNKWHIASLWVGMSVCIPTYMLASNDRWWSLMERSPDDDHSRQHHCCRSDGL